MGLHSIQVDAILFDMDGTLIDSLPGVVDTWGGFARLYSRGAPLSGETLAAKTHGRPLIDTLPELFNIPGSIHEAVEDFQTRVIEYADGPDVLPGVTALLKQLVTIAPDKWTVVTSATRGYAMAAFDKCGFPYPTKEIVTASETLPGEGKPHPAPYLAGARMVSRDDDFASRCLVIEDAPSGLTSGKRAGAKTLGVCTSHDRKFLESRLGDERADFIVESLVDVSVQVSSTGSLLVTIDDGELIPN